MRKRSTNIAAGAVVLAGAAYLAGILTAPKSGKETRKDIQRAALKAKTETEKKLKTLHSELGNLIDDGKHRARDASDTAKAGYADALARAQFAKEKARQLLSTLHEGDATDEDLKKAINEVTKAIDHLKTFLSKET